MPANNLTPFAFDEDMVRVICDEHGEPWFVAKDVAKALGYQWNGVAAIQHVPEEWRVVRSVLTSFGEKETWLLSEQGLYFFLGRSDKPKALPFQKWLAGEVLPSLRKTGAYAVDGATGESEEKLSSSERRLFGEELLASARSFSPKVRDKGLDYALQIARICGVGTRDDLKNLLTECCEFISGGASPVGILHGQDAEGTNAVARFLAEGCEHDPGFRISSEKLWKAYTRWLAENLGPHEHVLSNKRFSNELRRLGVRPIRVRPTTLFAGVRPLTKWR